MMNNYLIENWLKGQGNLNPKVTNDRLYITEKLEQEIIDASESDLKFITRKLLEKNSRSIYLLLRRHSDLDSNTKVKSLKVLAKLKQPPRSITNLEIELNYKILHALHPHHRITILYKLNNAKFSLNEEEINKLLVVFLNDKKVDVEEIRAKLLRKIYNINREKLESMWHKHIKPTFTDEELFADFLHENIHSYGWGGRADVSKKLLSEMQSHYTQIMAFTPKNLIKECNDIQIQGRLESLGDDKLYKKLIEHGLIDELKK